MSSDSEQIPPSEDELRRAHFAGILGSNVTRLRDLSHISKMQFSLMTGISRTQLDKIERGTVNLRLGDIAKLSAALNTTPAVLLTPVGEEAGIGSKSGHAQII